MELSVPLINRNAADATLALTMPAGTIKLRKNGSKIIKEYFYNVYTIIVYKTDTAINALNFIKTSMHQLILNP
ncbi:hypothetical protein FW778_01110 [Ginsengibacter hankyongi]|uniref:Uncharacterized protein n=1 Tax=Ginsengibacter hankyongi TaxID=2607284 RepID=A0A5J5IJI7_9BACT|nr:hypothetical protein [Ginsengibacter hankyongi]KAA9040668.1 hypothetical protein FW778_01110 [Ginsengibacter hankyongi]